MAIGKRFLDQYSVICVFGSVVGCVVFPLITQSVESLILSAIVISLTAKTLGHKMLTAPAETGNVKDDRRKLKDRDRDRDRHQEKDSPHMDKKQIKKKKQNTSLLDPPVMMSTDSGRVCEGEDQDTFDKERKLEEKREKKAKKKVERLKRKEEERRERELEEVKRKERQVVRASKKQCKSVQQQFGFTPIKELSQLSNLPQRTIHHRNGSTSSTHSLPSTKTKQSRRPIRASSDTILLGSESPVSPPLTPSPNKTSPWKPLPTCNISPRWQPDLFEEHKRIEQLPPAPVEYRNHQADMLDGNTSRSVAYCNGSLSLPAIVDTNDLRLTTKSQSYESLNSQVPRQCWVPGPSSAPTNLRQIMKEEQTAVMFQPGSSGGQLYTLFSGEQSPFSSTLFTSPGRYSEQTTPPQDKWPEFLSSEAYVL